jgi:outer membrane protein OmpA-like peptidoglycan-associated protein
MTFRKTPLALAMTGVLALTACETITDPNNPNRNTQQGALIGAAAGIVTGVISGGTPEERRRRAALGAVIGGGGGALIGQNLDQQEADLRAQMGNNVSIQNTGSELNVTLPQDILFATGSAQLTGSLQSDLQALAQNLNQYPNTNVNVIGHTDNVGEAGFNQSLSSQRANSVSNVLINSGVSSGRINAFGRGEDQPISTNLTTEGRQQNRRVEIIITPV